VEGVHHDGRTGLAGEQCGGAADRAGLRRMRVEDVRSHLADEDGDARDRHGVEYRRDLAVELRDGADVDAELVGDERHRSFAARK